MLLGNQGNPGAEAINDLVEILSDLVLRLAVKLDRSKDEVRLAQFSLVVLSSLCLNATATLRGGEIFEKELPAMLLLSLAYLGSPFDGVVFTLFQKLILPERKAQGVEALELASLAWSEKSFGEGVWAQTPAAQSFLRHLESLGELKVIQDHVTSASTAIRFKALVERSVCFFSLLFFFLSFSLSLLTFCFCGCGCCCLFW